MTATTTPSDPVKAWRQYSAKRQEGSSDNVESLSIGLMGTFTVDPLIPYVGGRLIQKGFAAVDLTVGPYNQVYQLCFNPEATLERDRLDVIVILWRVEDLIPENLYQTLLGNEAALADLYSEVSQLIDAIATLRKKFEGTIIVTTPPYPALPSFDIHELQQPTTGGMLHTNILNRWIEGLQQVGGIKILDINGLLSNEGYQSSHDARKWYLYRQPYTEDFWSIMGEQLSRIISAQTISAKKCVVIDCDNTLWGGIVGEDGLTGIALGEEFPGRAFRDFQKYLLHLRNNGIFLAIASKNNAEDVFEVFDTHDAMVLKRDHISVFEVHWDSKVESLKNIANALNISTDALVFVDDNPKEIEEVKMRLESVSCFMVPEETAYLSDLLCNTGLFDIAELTSEDRERSNMMLAEQKRRDIKESQSEEDFLNSLELTVDVFEVEPRHIARVTQLINKTNQFNVTTIRRTQDEVEALSSSQDTLILAMEVGDRFGEYGLVGVAIVTKATGAIWNIDTLLMSCRVLGRGAETSLIARVSEAVARQGGDTLYAEYEPTKKNALVKSLYPDHGFIFNKDINKWIAVVNDVKKSPDYVKSTLELIDNV